MEQTNPAQRVLPTHNTAPATCHPLPRATRHRHRLSAPRKMRTRGAVFIILIPCHFNRSRGGNTYTEGKVLAQSQLVMALLEEMPRERGTGTAFAKDVRGDITPKPMSQPPHLFSPSKNTAPLRGLRFPRRDMKMTPYVLHQM